MKIWSDKRYYREIARKETFDHPGFLRAVELCRDAKKILDVGCGDGSKLKKLGNKNTKQFGCDVSPLTKTFGYDVIYGERLPYENDSFDKVVSFFVLEHTNNPLILLDEMARVLDKDGLLILLAPNFGAPNRASPNFVGSRLLKLFFNPIWHKVVPNNLSMDKFESDLDTTLEPFLADVVNYLKSIGLQIIEKNSFWEMEMKNARPIQKIFRYLFSDWGPHLFIVAKKS